MLGDFHTRNVICVEQLALPWELFPGHGQLPWIVLLGPPGSGVIPPCSSQGGDRAQCQGTLFLPREPRQGHRCHQSSRGMETLPRRGLAQGVSEATFPGPTFPSASCSGMWVRPAGLRHRCQARNEHSGKRQGKGE